MKKKFHFPSTAGILMIFCLGVMLLTYVVPAGQFERALDDATGRNIVVAGTYTEMESTPAGLWDLFASVYNGFLDVADICAVILICGGSIGLLIETGAIQAGIGALVKKTGNKTYLMFIVLMIVFALGTCILGLGEEYMIFIPILCSIFVSLGYDELTAVAVTYLSAVGGQAFALVGPFNLMIAQSIAELPLLSGAGLRTVGFVGSLGIAMVYTILHANKVKKQNTKLDKESGAIIIDTEKAQKQIINLDDYPLTTERKVVLLIFAAITAFMAWGIVVHAWYFEEMCAIFMAMALIIGLYYFKSFNKMVDLFLSQGQILAPTLILLSLARGIVVLMNTGNIADTLINWMAEGLSGVSGVFGAWAIYLANIVINLFIPSCSGQATAVMPILTPLADLIGISRQVVVHCFMAADSMGNIIIPTHTLLVASLSLSGVSFAKWFKFAWKLFLIWTAWAFLILAIGVMIGW